VLANDTDADGDSLSVTAVSAPLHGSAASRPDGTITYTPAAGFTGSDTIAYAIADGHAGTANATVAMTVQTLSQASAALATMTDATGINQLSAAARNANRQINSGQTTQATRTLQRYIGDVDAQVARGNLTPQQGALLKGLAQALLNGLP